jgi:hypothetical protein
MIRYSLTPQQRPTSYHNVLHLHSSPMTTFALGYSSRQGVLRSARDVWQEWCRYKNLGSIKCGASNPFLKITLIESRNNDFLLIRHACWHCYCERASSCFIFCPGCELASYCSLRCQRRHREHACGQYFRVHWYPRLPRVF